MITPCKALPAAAATLGLLVSVQRPTGGGKEEKGGGWRHETWLVMDRQLEQKDGGGEAGSGLSLSVSLQAAVT